MFLRNVRLHWESASEAVGLWHRTFTNRWCGPVILDRQLTLREVKDPVKILPHPPPPSLPGQAFLLEKAQKEFELRAIQWAMGCAHNEVATAAKLLGLKRTTLCAKLRRAGIHRKVVYPIEQLQRFKGLVTPLP